MDAAAYALAMVLFALAAFGVRLEHVRVEQVGEAFLALGLLLAAVRR